MVLINHMLNAVCFSLTRGILCSLSIGIRDISKSLIHAYMVKECKTGLPKNELIKEKFELLYVHSIQ